MGISTSCFRLYSQVAGMPLLTWTDVNFLFRPLLTLLISSLTAFSIKFRLILVFEIFVYQIQHFLLRIQHTLITVPSCLFSFACNVSEKDEKF